MEQIHLYGGSVGVIVSGCFFLIKIAIELITFFIGEFSDPVSLLLKMVLLIEPVRICTECIGKYIKRDQQEKQKISHA